MHKPLTGFTVLDFGQFLSAPSAGLRLADLGAEVIKVEKTGQGDICRNLYISKLKIDHDSSLFHAINRNKQGIAVDLKSKEGQEKIQALLKTVDIMLINFRPGVSKKLGLDYAAVKKIHPKIIYGEITGYGCQGPWVDRPGQDLLVQALSGIGYLNGNRDQAPLPFGLSIADLLAGEHLVQGILAALYHRLKTGEGTLIETDLLSSLLDIQFESLTTYLNNGEKLPLRSAVNNANPYLGAPYGIYQTQDGYIAIAMCPLTQLATLLHHDELATALDKDAIKNNHDQLKIIIQNQLITQSSQHWLAILEPADIWCTEVLQWKQLTKLSQFKELAMVQSVLSSQATPFDTLRCPIRINGKHFTATKGAPELGENNQAFNI